jgi:hypothetical protein
MIDESSSLTSFNFLLQSLSSQLDVDSCTSL